MTTGVEIVRDGFSTGGFRAVIFDFDGTLSLVRRNWQDVMIPMMVDELAALGSGESAAELYAHVEDFVMRLNGRQTIYQMLQLADEVRSRGGTPRDAVDYKRQYHDLLLAQIHDRREALRQGADSETSTVPGSRDLLTRLGQLGLVPYLASGTDLVYVREELELLQLDGFFGGRVFGALDDYQNFSKRMIIEKIISETGFGGGQLLGFGDGFVEIEEVKRAGGVAVGVASEEEARQGVNAWKRERLIRAGADIIVGDYRDLDLLVETLGLA